MMRPLTIKIGDLEVGLRPVPYLVAYGYAECWNEDPVARPMLALTFLGEALDHPDVPERELAEVRLTYAQRVADWLLSHGVSVQVAVSVVSRNAHNANGVSGQKGSAEAQLRQGHGHHASPVPSANTRGRRGAGA
jgi:hypothetical protein